MNLQRNEVFMCTVRELIDVLKESDPDAVVNVQDLSLAETELGAK